VVNVASVQQAFDAFWATATSEAETLEWMAIPFSEMRQLYQDIQELPMFMDNAKHNRRLTQKERLGLVSVHSMLGIYSDNFRKIGFNPRHFMRELIPHALQVEKEAATAPTPPLVETLPSSTIGGNVDDAVSRLSEENQLELEHFLCYPPRKQKDPMTFNFRTIGRTGEKTSIHGKNQTSRRALMLELLEHATLQGVEFPSTQFNEQYSRQDVRVRDITVAELKQMRETKHLK
jgi:hypothetical protein